MENNFLDFDFLVKLAKEDPESLEALRLRLVEDLINAAPEHCQRKLKGLQFKIDMVKRKHKSPMGACIEISKMMRESFESLKVEVNKLSK